MASFTDTFTYDNGDLVLAAGTAWKTIDTNNGLADGIEVWQNYATNDEASNVCRAVYQTTVPTGVDQEVAAWITSAEEESTTTMGCYVDVGLGALKTPANIATDPLGIYARLRWDDDGSRVLSIRHFLRNGSDTEAASATLVLSGGVEASGYEGVLTDTGEAGTLQQLRLIVTAESSGLRCRAFVNENDDDRPTLECLLASDFVNPTATSTDYGAWWFGFGDASAARKLAVAQIYGADYDQDTDSLEQELREDQVTLAELRQRVRTRYEKSANTSLSDDMIDFHIRDEVEQILNRLGDVAHFAVREETLDLAPDSLCEVTLYARMKRVIGLRDASTGANQWFTFKRLGTDGAPVIMIEGGQSKSYKVRYLMRHRQMMHPQDVCPIPREHTEVLVVGACLRLAEQDRNANMQQTFLARHEMLYREMIRDMNRHGDQMRTRMDPRRPRKSYRRASWISRWT